MYFKTNLRSNHRPSNLPVIKSAMLFLVYYLFLSPCCSGIRSCFTTGSGAFISSRWSFQTQLLVSPTERSIKTQKHRYYDDTAYSLNLGQLDNCSITNLTTICSLQASSRDSSQGHGPCQVKMAPCVCL